MLRERGRAVAAPAEGPRLGRRGHTPVAVVRGKGSGRVSAAGMTCYKRGARSRFFYRIRIHTGRKGERRSLSEADYAGDHAAHQQLHAALILCWDNLNTHISAQMRTLLHAHREWLTVVQLPSYAADLNAVEGAWSNMKNSLGNLGSCGTPHRLAAIIKNRLKRIQYRPALIDGFLAQAGRSLEPEPP